MPPRVKAPKPLRKYKYAIHRAPGAPPLPTLSNVDSPVSKSPSPVLAPRRPTPEKKVQPAVPRFAFSSLMSGIEKNTDTKVASKKLKVGLPSSSNGGTKATKSPPTRPAKEATAKILKRKPVVETKPVVKTKPVVETKCVVETSKSAKTTTSKRNANDISRDNSSTSIAKEEPIKTLTKGTNKRKLSPEVVHVHDNPTPPPSKKARTQAETPVRETSVRKLNTKPIKPSSLRTIADTKPTAMLSPPRSLSEPQLAMTSKMHKSSSGTSENRAPLPAATSKIHIPSKAPENKAQPTYRESFLGPLAMRYGTSTRDKMGPKWAIAPEGKMERRYWESLSAV
ncbi:hypothetical protein P167DRAFT_544542 [Morchella conica CCBAS932]|uniref:Uncharacterized protein n=1 Tax=Morchella conica CCBAS932 TaxID=1392247 RepID=A0A3N4KVQ1_9PEZI|nr:hypothetical protein P167DRAFT_544542 [Morchella conica CCBAS932]